MNGGSGEASLPRPIPSRFGGPPPIRRNVDCRCSATKEGATAWRGLVESLMESDGCGVRRRRLHATAAGPRHRIHCPQEEIASSCKPSDICRHRGPATSPIGVSSGPGDASNDDRQHPTKGATMVWKRKSVDSDGGRRAIPRWYHAACESRSQIFAATIGSQGSNVWFPLLSSNSAVTPGKP